MLITVPLMIWSARTRDRQPGMEQRDEHARADRGEDADDEGGGRPEDRPGHDVGHRLVDDHRGHEPDEGRRQHHPLDADVDDAAPLVHDAAQRPEGDRGGELQGLGRQVRREDRIRSGTRRTGTRSQGPGYRTGRPSDATPRRRSWRSCRAPRAPDALGAAAEQVPDDGLGGQEEQDQTLDDVDDLDRDLGGDLHRRCAGSHRRPGGARRAGCRPGGRVRAGRR